MSTPPHPPRVITIVDVYRAVRRYKRQLLVGALAGLVLAVGLTLILPRKYTAQASFVPQKKETQSALAGLASQFGFALPATGDGESAEFYTELLTSRTILGQVADSTYSVTPSPSSEGSANAQRQSLATLYDIHDDDPRKQRELVIDKLKKLVRAEKTRTTDIVTISVTTKWPHVSHQIAANLLAMVSEFNVHNRQSRASAERKFVEGRLQQARAELRAAENDLQAFLQSNRNFSGSPQLQMTRTRLMRIVTNREDVVRGLEESYEKARIEEVRNTPVISIVEPPVVPARSDPRKLPGWAILGAIVGTLVTTIFLGVRGALRSLRAVADAEVTGNSNAVDPIHQLAFEDPAHPQY
jgi:tyrosine-protein kinase Etk/Wzc